MASSASPDLNNNHVQSQPPNPDERLGKHLSKHLGKDLGKDLGKRLADGLPDSVVAKLTEDEIDLIAASVDLDREQPWRRRHPIDARYSFPWIGGRAYMRIMAGLETRTPKRTRSENKRGNARSLVNILLIGAIAAIFYSLIAWGILVASAVIA